MLDNKNIRFNPAVIRRIRPQNSDLVDLFGLVSLFKPNHCYHKVQSYIAYAAKTTGRRGMTLFDVITDMNTFLILWADPKASYWACFLLSSILLPYIIFWSSSHNFENATRAHTSFNRRPPTNLTEHATRIFYYMAALPIVGLFISFLQIMIWWICEMVLGLFHQKLHQRLVTRMEMRERIRLFRGDDSKFRQLPLLPSKNAARYLTIIELVFESIPQSVLQLYIYLGGTSSYFTLQDVVISLTASLLNIVMNTRTIVQDAHCVGMSVFDYTVYFMGDRIGEMLTNLVPVNKILVSDTLHVCDITGCDVFYCTDIPFRLHDILRNCEEPSFHKTIVLPAIPEDMQVSVLMLDILINLVVHVRDRRNLHVTFATTGKEVLYDSTVNQQFRTDSMASYLAQRSERNMCVERCQTCLNCIACCQVRFGDLVCGERKQTVDELWNRSSKKKTRSGTRARSCLPCCRKSLVQRSRREPNNLKVHVVGLIRSLWPLLVDDGLEPYDGSTVNLMLFHALTTDYGALYAICEKLKEYGNVGKPFQQLVDRTKGSMVGEEQEKEWKWERVLHVIFDDEQKGCAKEENVC